MKSIPPQVTVIIPCHNAEAYIDECLDSVLGQTFQDFEIIVVDDGSRDDSGKILERRARQDARVRIITHAIAQGPGPARNQGLEHGRGRMLAFLDADDAWHQHKLERQLEFMAKTGAAFSFTDYQGRRPDGSLGGHAGVPSRRSARSLLFNTAIGCSTVIVERALVGDHRFPPIPRRQDFALWLLLLEDCRTAMGLQEVLTDYRLGHASVSSNRVRAAKDTWKVMREYSGQPLVVKLAAFPGYVWNAYWRKRRLARPRANQ